MKTEKKIVRLLVALVIATSFALPSCGNKQTGNENNNTEKIFEIPVLSFGEVEFGVNVHEEDIIGTVVK